MSNSNWTGRTPRTLAAAFGPHTSSEFSEPRISIFAGLTAWVRSFFA